jgi:hypothetical protein
MVEMVDRITQFFSPAEPVSIEAGAALERVCQSMLEANNNQPMNAAHCLADDLAFLARPGAGAAVGEESRWTLRSSASAEVGKTLIFQKPTADEQELTLSLDARGTLYLGSWRSLKAGETHLGFVFHVEPSQEGGQLVISDGQHQRQFALENNSALAGWVSLAGFLGGLQNLARDEAVSPPPGQPAAKLTLSTVPPQAASLSPVLPPASGESTILRPSQTLCPRCGTLLGPGVRFCSQCGAPVQSVPIPTSELTVPATLSATLRPKSSLSPREMQLVVQPGGQTIALKGKLSIGREPDNDLYLDDTRLDYHHAVIEAAADGWLVRDLGSANGTRVNGKPIRDPLMIQAGDVIELGDTRLRLEYR